MQKPQPRDFALLFLLASIWGSSFLLIKYALDRFPPLTIAAGRICVAAVSLLVIGRFLGHRLPGWGREWRYFAAIGLLGSVLPFTLIAWGETHISSALAAILVAFVPISTTVLAHFLTGDEKMNKIKVAGVTIGFAGVVLVVGGVDLESLKSNLPAQLGVLTAAFCYALSGILAKRISRVHPPVTATGVSSMAAIMILPLSLIVDRPWTLDPSLPSTAAVVTLGLASTAGGALILFHLIPRTGATFVSLNNYLVPVVATILGLAILDEQLLMSTIIGFILILVGIAATSLNSRIVKKISGKS